MSDENFRPTRSVPVQEPLSGGRRRMRPVFGLALVVAAAAAALVALVINSRNAESPGGSRPVVVTVPRPNPTDLTRTFPKYGRGGGVRVARPWDTGLSFAGGGAPPYAAHLRLSAEKLPSSPSRLSAYRLAGGSFDTGRVEQIARTLGIHGSVKRSTQRSGTWVYIQEGRGGAQPRARSVAINVSSGELIYHDINPGRSNRRLVPHNAPHKVAISRAWLSSIGWPGTTMPVHTTTAIQETSMASAVSLGWTAAPHTDAPEAVLVQSPNGQIISADIWPPIDRIFFPLVRGYASAWLQVRDGKVPIGLLGQPVHPPRSGTGVVTHTDVLNVFTSGANGLYWLVPAYRFEGTARIPRSARSQGWVAVSPAARS